MTLTHPMTQQNIINRLSLSDSTVDVIYQKRFNCAVSHFVFALNKNRFHAKTTGMIISNFLKSACSKILTRIDTISLTNLSSVSEINCSLFQITTQFYHIRASYENTAFLSKSRYNLQTYMVRKLLLSALMWRLVVDQ